MKYTRSLIVDEDPELLRPDVDGLMIYQSDLKQYCHPDYYPLNDLVAMLDRHELNCTEFICTIAYVCGYEDLPSFVTDYSLAFHINPNINWVIHDLCGRTWYGVYDFKQLQMKLNGVVHDYL